MSNSTTLLDIISALQASKEATANAMFDAASTAMLFGRRASACSALTWGYYGGRMLVDGVLTAVANGTVALTASTTNYVEATRAGVVSKNTTAFTAGSIPLYTIVTGTATVTSYTDERCWVDPEYITHDVAVTVTTADVTLTAAQARSSYISASGALTGNRNIIVPNNWEGAVYNGCSGAFTLTVKTSVGTGIDVDASDRVILRADGTNVVKLSSATGGYSLPIAEAAVLGGIKVGTGLAIDPVTGVLSVTAGAGTVGRHAIYVAAGSISPSVTGGCAALAKIASAANQPDIVTLDFDATTQEYAQFSVVMPKKWNEGTVTFVPHWSHAATTTNFGVVWDLQAVAVSNDDAIAVAFGTAQTSTDTGGTTNDLYTGPESSAITIAGTSAAEDMVFFRLSRVTGNGSDTMAIDARLHGITLYITTAAETDA
jgi:hypothetical protein